MFSTPLPASCGVLLDGQALLRPLAGRRRLSTPSPRESWMTLRLLRFATVACALVIWHAAIAEDAPPDYAAERMELATSPDYNPYMLQLMHNELMSLHYELAEDPTTEIDEINEPLAELEAMYPLGIQVNYTVAAFIDYVVSLLEEQGAEQSEIDTLAELADARRTRARAILDSILDSGDGTSPETAYVVINIIEEYAVLDHFGLRISNQSLLNKDGKVYDLIVGTDDDGTERDFYFDITIFFRE